MKKLKLKVVRILIVIIMHSRAIIILQEYDLYQFPFFGNYDVCDSSCSVDIDSHRPNSLAEVSNKKLPLE